MRCRAVSQLDLIAQLRPHHSVRLQDRILQAFPRIETNRRATFDVLKRGRKLRGYEMQFAVQVSRF